MRFSLILPVYNVEKYISKCLDSIIEQTFSDFEVILVDDGSKDKSFQVCASYAQKDSRIKVIRKENEGVSAARNKGIEAATGEWVVFVDPDDWLSTDCLEKCEAMIQKYNVDAICYNAVKVIEADNNSEKEMKKITPDQYAIEKSNMHELLYALAASNYRKTFYAGEMIRAVWGKALKTDIINNHKIRFDTKLTHGEDCVFLMEYFSKCRNCLLMNQYLYYYNIRQGSAVTSGPKNMDDLYKYQFMQIYHNLSEYTSEKDCETVLDVCKLGCVKNYIRGMNKSEKSFWNKYRTVKKYFGQDEFLVGKYIDGKNMHIHRREILGCKLLDKKLFFPLLLLYKK